MKEGRFLTEAYARNSDPDTSHEAALKASRTKSEKAVYDTLNEAKGVPMTTLCVSRHLGVNPWSISPRFAPLERKGLIERCGKKTVLNSSGKPASLTAWRVKST